MSETFGVSKKIVLDLQRNKHVSIRVAQNDIDSREVIIRITDDGKPYFVDSSTTSVRIIYKKSDGNNVVNDITSENILTDGTIRLVLSEQMCASYGLNDAQILLINKSTGQAIHTMKFYVVVVKSSVDNDTITSTNEFISFQNALGQLEHILFNLKPITEGEIDEMFN